MNAERRSARRKAVTTVYLDAAQLATLNEMAVVTGRPAAAYIRDGIDLVIERWRLGRLWTAGLAKLARHVNLDLLAERWETVESVRDMLGAELAVTPSTLEAAIFWHWHCGADWKANPTRGEVRTAARAILHRLVEESETEPKNLLDAHVS